MELCNMQLSLNFEFLYLEWLNVLTNVKVFFHKDFQQTLPML